LSLGLFLRGDPTLRAALAGDGDRRGGYAIEPHASTHPTRPGWPALARGARVFDEPGLQGSLDAKLLGWITGFGFTHRPAPLDVDLSPRDRVVVPWAHALAWMEREDESLLLAVHGDTFAVARDPAAVAVLQRLCTGEPARARDLVAPYPRRQRRALMQLLTELARRHALDVVPG
jgi:hypothetical protein